MRYVKAAGIGWTLARPWEGDRHREHQLKRQGGRARMCPICKETRRPGEPMNPDEDFLARIEQQAAEADASEDAQQAAEEAAAQAAADRAAAAIQASSRRDGRDYWTELMVAPYPDGVRRVWADLDRADARAEFEAGQ